jgi:putative ABC transport system permease protein
MMLLRLISWPYLRRHLGRTLLTVAAVAMGVGVFIAMRGANAVVMASFQETIDRIAGATELQITAGEPGFDESVLERVQEDPQVRVAAPVIEAVVGTRLPGQGNLLVLGVDMTGDRSLRDYDMAAGETAILDDPLIFLAQPDSIMVSADFAERNGLKIDSRVPLETVDGPKDFVVRGILRSTGLASAFGGNLAIMDVYAAQFVFGRGRKFDRIDLAVAKGATVPDVQAALQASLGPGFQVQLPAARAESFESLLRIYRYMLVFSSVFALAVGMFIIYNAFATAVAQRRGEIGLLRALGASRAAVGTLFVSEGLLIGLTGSVLGVVAGRAIVGTVTRVASGIVQGVYGVGGTTADVAPSAAILALAIGVGLVTSGLATLVPARAAALVDPVLALRKGGGAATSSMSGRIRMGAAVVLGITGAVLVLTETPLGIFYVGFLFLLVSSLLATPHAALWLVRMLRPALCRLRPVEGALAADSLIASPKRTSTTVAALMLSLALVISLAGVARGSYTRITDWVDTTLNADLFVTTSATLTERNYRFPDSMAADLALIPGVEEVQKFRSARIQMDGGPVQIIAPELLKTQGRSPRRAVAGDIDEMFRLAAAGQGVIASENFATLRRVSRGDTINIPTPGGTLSLPLVGVVREYSDQRGALLVDRTVFTKHWSDDTVDVFRLFLTPNTQWTDVKARILAAFADNRRIFVLSNADIRNYVLGLTDQWFTLSWAQLGIAILVAVLGIVNSLTVSVADRRRELGILRALGAFPNQVRWTIWMEALTVGIVSVVLGLLVGAVILYCQLELGARDFPGLRFDYLYPFTVAATLFPMILLTTLIGALAPAESAVRGSLVEALEYE